jgi:adenylate cyclase
MLGPTLVEGYSRVVGSGSRGCTVQSVYASRRLFPGGFHRPQRLALMIGLGFLLIFLFSWSGIIQTLELATYDLRLWLRGPRPPPPFIVIVAINDESFNALNQNIRTWRRTDYAHLIDTIAAGHPAVVGLDVAWIHASSTPDDDETLAHTLRQTGRVVLASLIEHQAGPGYEYDRYAAPIAPLAQGVAGVGLVNLPRDNDGIVRRVNPWQWHNDNWYPAFGYEVARVYLGQPATPFDPAAGPVTLGEHRFNLEDGQDFLINFLGGQATFPTFSMYQVLNGEVSIETFTNKIVLVGFTTSLEQDLHTTAFNHPWGSPELVPGVEIHANVIASLLNGDPIQLVASWFSISLSLAVVGLTGWAFWKLRPVQAMLGVGGVALLYLLGTFLLFGWANLWLPIVAPMGLTALTVAGGLVEQVLIEEQEKRQLRARFQSFMAPERLMAVLDHWEELLAEERAEISATVLFADIRGFTAATETMTRQGRSGEVIRFLNRYTDAMIEVIFTEHGVLDKMLGDGLLVLFGAPVPVPNHALLAVRAAWRMAALLPKLNEFWPLRDQRPLRIGIGIHSGSMMDGIIGRGRRVEYTVIGDAVNTAARIENYTKEVLARHLAEAGDDGQPGATILLTQATYVQVKDYVHVDSNIPPCRAKGKVDPIPVYRLLGVSVLSEEERGG